MLDVIQKAMLDNDPQGGVKNIILWSSNHDMAKEYFDNNLEKQTGHRWLGPLDVTLHNIPVWKQIIQFTRESPWCLSMTPAELFLGDYEYGVSANTKKTHEQQFRLWLETREIVFIQIDLNTDMDKLQHPYIIKHEQW